jgi:hypothetical protein
MRPIKPTDPLDPDPQHCFLTYSRLFSFQARVSGLVAAYPGYTPTCVTDSSGSNLYRFGLSNILCLLVHLHLVVYFSYL